MGMFDIVQYKAKCWRCGEELTDFQTKDGCCTLSDLTPKMIPGGRFYTGCIKCNAWNEFDVIAKKVEIILNEKESKLKSEENK